uniref:Uncharacterized protein n=1 Tax=Suricata suricatta TaxID=37032 RepID=A0A673SZE5_SURSU
MAVGPPMSVFTHPGQQAFRKILSPLLCSLSFLAWILDRTHVQAPVLLKEEVAQCTDALKIIDVQQVETWTQALGLELLHGRPAPRLVPCCEHYVPGELPAQVTHDGEADALVGPGHQRHAGVGRHD